MLANQIYSVNRLNGFLIAPLLGLYVDSGGGEGRLKAYAFVGCVVSAALLLSVLKMWPLVSRLCVNLLTGIARDGFSLPALKGLRDRESGRSYDLAGRTKDMRIIFVQSFITSLAMPTSFILNILAIRFPDYQATLVQSATVISGAGNLLLNFYIFPRIALEETRGEPDPIYYSVMLGKVLGIGILTPCIIAIM